MWNCGVLLFCVCVMIKVPTSYSDFRKFTNLGSDDRIEDVASSITFRRLPKERWQLETPMMSNADRAEDFRMRLLGIKLKKCPDNKTCASKCCPIGKGYDVLEDRCRGISHEFTPTVKANYTEIKGFNASKEFHILEGLIECYRKKKEEVKKLVSDVKRDFYLQKNGTLYLESDRAAGPGMVFNINKYCIDWFITLDNKTEWDAIICHIPRPFKRHRALTIACVLITCILVLLRVVVCACLPELQTLYGKILLAYLISFFVSLLLLAIQMFLTNGNYINREACSILSFIVYFVTMSAFFWKNVMCYDIWWTFSGQRAKSTRGSSSGTRFCLYCTYAFGWSTALTVLMVALEFSDLPDEHALMPKVRLHGCNGLDGYTKLIYYYVPILTLFVINMVLFAQTALKIAAIKKETDTVLKSKESGTHYGKNDEERFTLYANLFASMLFLEVNWIFESVIIFYPDAEKVFMVSDFCNVAVVLYILVNFLCKKRTWIMIKKRYQHMWGLSSEQTTVASNNRTLTSQTSQNSQNSQNSQISQSTQISQSQDYSIASDQWNPNESQNETHSPDFIPEKSTLAESQEDTQSLDAIIEKSSSTKSQENTQSLDFIRGKTSSAASQEDTQSPDLIREKSSPAESQEFTQSSDFIQEKSSPAEIQDNTQSPNFKRQKTISNEKSDDSQSPEITVDTKRAIVITRNTFYRPSSIERSRTLPRARTALSLQTAVEKRQSLLRSSFRDPSINTDGVTFQLFKGRTVCK